MTTCDHGIRLDRYCGDCEAGFTFVTDYARENRHRAGRIAAACLLGCALIVLVALGRNGS